MARSKTSTDPDTATTTDSERLELRYVPLTQAKRWDENPKRHDIEALMVSIETHGFGDPPKYDTHLDGLVYGNGRTEALEQMRQRGKPVPRGVAMLEDGEWAVPVIFGVDSASRAAAVAFAIDHNNLGLLGGNLGFKDLLALWDEEGLKHVLADVPDSAELLASFEEEQIQELFAGPDFSPVSEDEQPQLDEVGGEMVCCPECGHEWVP